MQYMVQLAVSSAVQGLSYRSIGYASHTASKKDEPFCGVLSSLVEKVFKQAVES